MKGAGGREGEGSLFFFFFEIHTSRGLACEISENAIPERESRK